MLVNKLNYFKLKKRGKELKIPYYTSAAAVRDGNLPYIMAICLYSQQYIRYIIDPIDPTDPIDLALLLIM